jgi:signal transduction histidine kinase
VRKAEFPFLADWFAITLRWLVLVSLALNHALAAPPEIAFTLFSGLIVGWNLFLAQLAVSYRRMPAHRVINVLVDFVLSLALFVVSGGLTGPIPWTGVLALLSAAVYFEMRGALVVAFLVIVSETGYTAWRMGLGDIPAVLTPLGILAGLNLGIGVVLGLFSLRLMKSIRKRYQAHLTQRLENERKAQLRERTRLETFYSMVETLSATLNYTVVLESALELSTSAMGEESESDRLVSAVLLFDEEHLKVGSARGFSPTDMKRTFPAEEGILAETLRSGAIQHMSNPTEDAELGRVYGLQECAAAICLPLLRGLNAYGVMLFGHPQSGFFNEERRDLLEMISHQVVIAIQNARLFQDLEHEKNRLVESQEEARKKLARDLHDGPTQSVSAIAMRISIARRLLEQSPREVPGELERIEDLARRTTQEIRHMLFTLRPLALESEGLISALQQMSDKMREIFQQNVSLDIDPATVKALDNGKQTVVFYLVEEAVNNARKHAQASEIHARLKFFTQDQSMALLEIADNGKGFDVASVNASYEKRGSLGMVNLQERAELINAALNIQSVPGKGTRVQVLIPLTEAALDRLQRGLVAAKVNVN